MSRIVIGSQLPARNVPRRDMPPHCSTDCGEETERSSHRAFLRVFNLGWRMRGHSSGQVSHLEDDGGRRSHAAKPITRRLAGSGVGTPEEMPYAVTSSCLFAVRTSETDRLQKALHKRRSRRYPLSDPRHLLPPMSTLVTRWGFPRSRRPLMRFYPCPCTRSWRMPGSRESAKRSWPGEQGIHPTEEKESALSPQRLIPLAAPRFIVASLTSAMGRRIDGSSHGRHGISPTIPPMAGARKVWGACATSPHGGVGTSRQTFEWRNGQGWSRQIEIIPVGYKEMISQATLHHQQRPRAAHRCRLIGWMSRRRGSLMVCILGIFAPGTWTLPPPANMNPRGRTKECHRPSMYFPFWALWPSNCFWMRAYRFEEAESFCFAIIPFRPFLERGLMSAGAIVG